MKLNQIVQLRFGLYAKPVETGDVAYIQAKHFNEWGKLDSTIDTFIHNKFENHLLKDGDILLAGKGLRNFAWVYGKNFEPAIASSIFYVIRPDQSKVMPDYLSLLFNTTKAQLHFQTLGAGSSIPSIRKSELEAFTLQLPSFGVQRKAIEIKKMHDQDMELSYRIIQEKQKLYQAITNHIITNNHE